MAALSLLLDHFLVYHEAIFKFCIHNNVVALNPLTLSVLPLEVHSVNINNIVCTIRMSSYSNFAILLLYDMFS